MARPCETCGSTLHGTKIHRFWKKHDAPHSCLDDKRVKALVEVVTRMLDRMDKHLLDNHKDGFIIKLADWIENVEGAASVRTALDDLEVKGET